MADPAILPRFATDGHVVAGRRGRRAGLAGVTAEEVRGVGLALVVARLGQASALVAKVRETYGIELPTEPRHVAGGQLSAAWCGAGRWLVMLPGVGHTGLEPVIAQTLAGRAAIVEQSHALMLVQLSGLRVREAMAKGFAIDLHPRVFTTGHAALTVVAHVPAQLWQAADDPVYEVAVPRSLGLAFWRWLEASTGEYGLEVLPPREARTVQQV